MNRRTVLESLTLAPFASLLLTRGVLGGTSPSPAGPRARYFPNVTLRTHEDKTVRFYDDLMRGKIVVINFMYAHCEGLCPRTTENLVKVQKALGERVGRDIFMYSLTLKPDRKYAEGYGVKPGWLFLTGKGDDIERLRRKLGFVDPDPVVDADKSQHIGVVLYGNEALDRWAACPALSRPTTIAEYILWIGGVEETARKGLKPLRSR